MLAYTDPDNFGSRTQSYPGVHLM